MKVLFFLVSALAIILTPHGQAWSQSDTRKQTEIIAAEHEWARAAVDRDIATFAKYMSDDYLLIEVIVTPGKQSPTSRRSLAGLTRFAQDAKSTIQWRFTI